MTTLHSTPRIALAPGRIAGLGSDVRALINRPIRVLVVMDPGLAAGGLVGRLEAALKAERQSLVLFDGLTGEPTAADIDRAADLARTERVEAVVGIGGGSALDVAKLVAAIAVDDPGADHYQLARIGFPPEPLPLILAPTTAGTGSEATLTAVHTNAQGRKVWSWGSELAARLIVLDPELTLSLPPRLTAATGIDALVHALEAATNRNASSANNVYCHEAIRLIARWLPTAVAEPQHIEAREAMLWASCLAGIGINNAGTAIAHTIAHALGSIGKVHHGRAAGLGLRAAASWCITHNADAFAAVAAAMGGPRDAAALPDLVDGLVRRVGLKIRLDDELPALSPERLAAEMALEENAAMLRSTARPAGEADLLALATAVLEAR
jgi:alcohol dehydrogenase class IV